MPGLPETSIPGRAADLVSAIFRTRRALSGGGNLDPTGGAARTRLIDENLPVKSLSQSCSTTSVRSRIDTLA